MNWLTALTIAIEHFDSVDRKDVADALRTDVAYRRMLNINDMHLKLQAHGLDLYALIERMRVSSESNDEVEAKLTSLQVQEAMRILNFTSSKT